MDGQTGKWMLDRWMDEQTAGWVDREKQMFRELDRLRQVESKRQMGGWTGRWIGRQMDGSQIDVSLNHMD